MFLSVALNFRRLFIHRFILLPRFFRQSAVIHLRSGPTKLPVGTKVVPIVHTTRNVRGLAAE
jgi:hypothetical protein